MRKNQQQKRRGPYEPCHQPPYSPDHTTVEFPDMLGVVSVWGPRV